MQTTATPNGPGIKTVLELYDSNILDLYNSYAYYALCVCLK